MTVVESDEPNTELSVQDGFDRSKFPTASDKRTFETEPVFTAMSILAGAHLHCVVSSLKFEALGGGGDDDIRDGILTLPAAIAIRNPETAAIFCNPDQRKREELAAAFQAALPEAEQFLDEIAAEACHEATKNAPYPHGLLALVDYTRGLSRR